MQLKCALRHIDWSPLPYGPVAMFSYQALNCISSMRTQFRFQFFRVDVYIPCRTWMTDEHMHMKTSGRLCLRHYWDVEFKPQALISRYIIIPSFHCHIRSYLWWPWKDIPSLRDTFTTSWIYLHEVVNFFRDNLRQVVNIFATKFATSRPSRKF